jgi:hypothetical protein
MTADAPTTWPEGTHPGTERLIGKRCDVRYTDTTGRLPQYVLRVGKIARVYTVCNDAGDLVPMVSVELPWGAVVEAQGIEVTPWE